MPNGLSVLLWLLFPIVVTTISWYLLRRRARQNPNADISAGVTELDRFRDTLRQTNPPPGYTPRRRRSSRSPKNITDRRR
jgi:hypothetical protein